jgi:hypothetical protein
MDEETIPQAETIPTPPPSKPKKARKPKAKKAPKPKKPKAARKAQPKTKRKAKSATTKAKIKSMPSKGGAGRVPGQHIMSVHVPLEILKRLDKAVAARKKGGKPGASRSAFAILAIGRMV